MAHKETWNAGELLVVGRFVGALQELLQEWGADGHFRVKDILLSIEDAEGREPQPWGVVSMQDKNDTVLQFEQGDYEIGLV